MILELENNPLSSCVRELSLDWQNEKNVNEKNVNEKNVNENCGKVKIIGLSSWGYVSPRLKTDLKWSQSHWKSQLLRSLFFPEKIDLENQSGPDPGSSI
ncbi:unnamed protein product [Allacma fusca]|uniref:Uncharacterized protein n=1 Tax=Allacma fusca TaxID=39272 RepID=A0A8J2JJC1_9HEXA|nr:unnamed protein product [Allacma fusca]